MEKTTGAKFLGLVQTRLLAKFSIVLNVAYREQRIDDGNTSIHHLVSPRNKASLRDNGPVFHRIVPDFRFIASLVIFLDLQPDYPSRGAFLMHLLYLSLIGATAGLVISVRYKVFVLVCSIFCAWGLVAVGSALGHVERGFAEFALSALIVAVALQVGYVAGVVIQAIWTPNPTTTGVSKPAITRR